jgi:hypothetical protein
MYCTSFLGAVEQRRTSKAERERYSWDVEPMKSEPSYLLSVRGIQPPEGLGRWEIQKYLAQRHLEMVPCRVDKDAVFLLIFLTRVVFCDPENARDAPRHAKTRIWRNKSSDQFRCQIFCFRYNR